MYQCSAACCENQHYNMEDVQRCLENCSTPVNRAQSFMQTELGGFQVCQYRTLTSYQGCQSSVNSLKSINPNLIFFLKKSLHFQQIYQLCRNVELSDLGQHLLKSNPPKLFPRALEFLSSVPTPIPVNTARASLSLD